MNIEKNKEILKETHESELPDVQFQQRVEVTIKGDMDKVVETSEMVTEAMIKERAQLLETAALLEQQAADVRNQAEKVQHAEDVKVQLKYEEKQKELEMQREEALKKAERISDDLAKGLSAAKEKVKGLAHSVAATAGAGLSKVGHVGTLIKETIIGVPDLAKDMEETADNLEENAADLRLQAEMMLEHAETASQLKVTKKEVKTDIPIEDFSQSEISQKMDQSSPTKEYTVESSEYVQPEYVSQFGGKPLEQSEHELKSVPRTEFHINKDEDILLSSDVKDMPKSSSMNESVQHDDDVEKTKEKRKSQSMDEKATYDESKRNVWKQT